jgi:hypothetical protein
MADVANRIITGRHASVFGGALEHFLHQEGATSKAAWPPKSTVSTSAEFGVREE